MDTYPEPFGEALGHSSQRAAQLTSLFIALTQAWAQYRARHEQQQAARDQAVAAELARQEQIARRQAQATWAAALDPAWLAGADLYRTARIWGAAMPYAHADPYAAAAMARCEDRLRDLHPYAMVGYDRARAEGAWPAEAMRQVIGMFDRDPRPRPGHPGPARHPLDAVPPAQPGTRPPGTGLPSHAQALAPEDPAIAASERRPWARSRASAERSPARLAAENFPHSAADGIRAAAAMAADAARPAVRTVIARPLRRPRYRP